MTALNREQIREQLRKKISPMLDCDNYPTEDVRAEASLRVTDSILSLEPLATLLSKLDETREICPACEGIGRAIYMERYSPDPTDVEPVEDICSRCLGSGRLGDWHPEKLVRLDDDQNLNVSPKYYADALKKSGWRKVKL